MLVELDRDLYMRFFGCDELLLAETEQIAMKQLAILDISSTTDERTRRKAG